MKTKKNLENLNIVKLLLEQETNGEEIILIISNINTILEIVRKIIKYLLV